MELELEESKLLQQETKEGLKLEGEQSPPRSAAQQSAAALRPQQESPTAEHQQPKPPTTPRQPTSLPRSPRSPTPLPRSPRSPPLRARTRGRWILPASGTAGMKPAVVRMGLNVAAFILHTVRLTKKT